MSGPLKKCVYMLNTALAVLSEHSCAADYRRAGKAVLELFPKWMVKKERESFKKGMHKKLIQI